MIRIISSREFLNNLFNLRFTVSMVLCFILTITCVVILIHDYKQEMTDYNLRITMQDEFLDEYAHTNRMSGIIRPQNPPEKLSPFIIGISRDANIGSFDDNPMPTLFPPLDLIFIVTIIMSLMAILFSYDAVAGERERGTLRLMVSSSVSRVKILLGKWIGGTASLMVPFIFSLLAGVLLITMNPAIQWHVSTWGAFFLLILASITFISIFYLLGLFVSTFSRLSSTSILTSLFLWVLFILVIPHLSPYISAQLYQIPSVTKIENEVNRITGIERDELGRKLTEEVAKRYAEQYGQLFMGSLDMNQDEIRQRVPIDPKFKTMQEAYRDEYNEAWDEANRIQGEKAEKLTTDLELKSTKQTQVAKNLACLSPYANFVYLATDLSGTGLRSLDYFSRFSVEYLEIFWEYADERYTETEENDPTFNSNSFLDVSDRPRFNFKEEPLKERVAVVLPYWGILLFFGTVFFICAFIGFIKYDVR